MQRYITSSKSFQLFELTHTISNEFVSFYCDLLKYRTAQVLQMATSCEQTLRSKHTLRTSMEDTGDIS